ncbi:MAG: hypothetical protein R2882_13810 [Gemmatimonadales bacterium]
MAAVVPSRPPPESTVKLTVTFGTARFAASRTTMVGGAATGVPGSAV